MRDKKKMRHLSLIMAAAVAVASPGTPLVPVYAEESSENVLQEGHVYERVKAVHECTVGCYEEGAILGSKLSEMGGQILSETALVAPSSDQYYVKSEKKVWVKHELGENEVGCDKGDGMKLYSYEENDDVNRAMQEDKKIVKFTAEGLTQLIGFWRVQSDSSKTIIESIEKDCYHKIKTFGKYEESLQYQDPSVIFGGIEVTNENKEQYQEYNEIHDCILGNDPIYFIPKEVTLLSEYSYNDKTVLLGSTYGLGGDNANKYFEFTPIQGCLYYGNDPSDSDKKVLFSRAGFYEEKEYWVPAKLVDDHEAKIAADGYVLQSDGTSIGEKTVIKYGEELLVDSSDKYVTSITLTDGIKQELASTAGETDIEDGVTLHYADGTKTEFVEKENVTNDYSKDQNYNTDNAYVTITGIKSDALFFKDNNNDKIVDENEVYKLSDVKKDFSTTIDSITKKIFQKIVLTVNEENKQLLSTPMIDGKVSEMRLTGVNVTYKGKEIDGVWKPIKYGGEIINDTTVFGTEAKTIEFRFVPSADENLKEESYEIQTIAISGTYTIDLSNAYDLKIGSAKGDSYTSGATVNDSVYVVAKVGYIVATAITDNFTENIVFEKPNVDAPLANYKFYIKGQEGDTAIPQVVQIAFDVTPPELSLEVSEIQTTSAKITVKANEDGTAPYLLSSKSCENITSIEDLGKEAEDKAIKIKDGVGSLTYSDLEPGQTYYIYMLAKDQAGNVSKVVPQEFTTYGKAITVSGTPTLSGTYGTAVKSLNINTENVTISDTTVSGNWSVEQSDDIPEVNGSTKYKVTFTPNDSTIAPVTVEVTPAITAVTPTITLSGLEQTVGSVAAPTVTVKPNDSKVSATLSYYSDQSCTTAVDFETVKNAAAGSTFYVKVALSGSSNYTIPENDTFTLTIKAKPNNNNNNNNPYYPPTSDSGSNTDETPTTPEKPSDTENTETPDTAAPDTDKPDTETPDSSTGNTTTETKPDGTVVDKNVETGADGTTTEKVTETKPDGSKSESVTETKADGSKTESVTETKADGSKTESVTEMKADGSKTESVTETKADGSKSESVTETKADGSKTESVTETKADGSKSESVTETKTDGSKTESVTETKTDGSKTESVTKTKADGSSVEKKVETAASGKVTKTTEITTAADGSATETVKQSEKNSAGKNVAVTTVTNTNTSGKVTGIVEQSKITNIAKNASATVTVKKNGKGKVTNATANVSKPMSSNKLSLSGTILSQLTEAAGVSQLDVEVKVTDNSGKTTCKIKAEADELVPGAKLFIYETDSKGNYVMLNSKTYKVNASGGVAISMTNSGTVVASNSVKTYELLTEKEAKAAAKAIKATIKASKASATVKAGKKTTMKLAKGIDMDNVKAITYTTSKKSVATVSKSGEITTKKAGTTTIKAKVTLKNGDTKTVSMKVKVKKK